MFSKWAQLNIERPRTALLVDDVPDFVGDRLRLDEEVVWFVWVALPCPLEVDHSVDSDIGDVHALRTELTGDRLGQNPLSRLRRREGGTVRLASPRRGVAGGDDRAFSGAYHRRRKPPR